jgi:methylmalonyl-CoA mutase N-terminal domain/subunit
MQNKIGESAYAYQKDIESNKKIIVGVNQFQSSNNVEIPILRIDESIRLQQIEKLKLLKSKRDQGSVDACLLAIKDAAINNTNIMPPVIDAVEKLCTLGEIADTLRSVFGEYQA